MKRNLLFFFTFLSLWCCQSSKESERLKAGLNGRLEIARQMVDSGDYPKAIDILQTIIKDAPDHAHAHMLMGTALLGMSNPEGARTSFTKVIALEPKNDDAKINLSYCLIMSKEFKLARSLLDQVLKRGQYLYPEKVHINYGLSYMEEGNCPRAERAFLQALQLEPTSIAAHFNKGLCAMRRGDFKAAVVSFQRALDFCSQCLDPALQLARARFQMGEKQIAIESLEKILRGKIDLEGADRTRKLLSEFKR